MPRTNPKNTAFKEKFANLDRFDGKCIYVILQSQALHCRDVVEKAVECLRFWTSRK
jgi:hypothetical protein